MKAMNRKIGVGVLWNLGGLFVSRGASTLFMLLLARILAPEAFGLVAMVTMVFELANAFVNSGLGAALIRSKNISGTDLSTVFYANIALSVVAYSLIYLVAPHVSTFYSQPELTSLVRVMGLVVFINATKIVQVAILSRKMDFKRQMKANTLGVIISGCLAIGAAWMGWGVWSLVVQMLGFAVISAIVLWFASAWRPSLLVSGESFWRLFSFGKNLLAEGLLSVLYQNSYVLVIGRFFSAEITGLYYIAKRISNLFSQQLTGAVQQATYPALSTLQDDNAALLLKYRQIMQLLMFLIAPVMGLLGGLAPTLFDLLFDPAWSGAVPYLQLLCLVGMLYPLHALNMNLLNVKGRSDLILKVGLVKKGVNLSLLFLAIPYGVMGIVVSQVLGSVVALIPNTYYSAKLVDYSFVTQIRDVAKPLLSGLLAGGIAWWIAETIILREAAVLLIAGSIGAILYLFLSILLRVEGAKLIWLKINQNAKPPAR